MTPSQPRSSSRREFLRSTLAVGGSLAVAPLWRDALAASQGQDDRILVVLEMAGGNDGLNTVVPFADDAYFKARGNLAISAQEVLRIDDEIGLHPAMVGLKKRYDAGQLAIIEGVGYPNPNRSHFLSMDIWESASLEGRRGGTGWIGRLADGMFGDNDDPNRVIAVDKKVPFSCEGDKCRAVAFANVGTYRMIGSDAMVSTLDSAVSSQHVSERARSFLRDAYLKARESSNAVREATGKYKPQAEYPGNNSLANDLKTTASLITGGLGTRIFAISLGGFDTHNNQATRQRRLLGDLSGALDAFLTDLEAHGVADRVTVLAFSEFGRRVKANASGGTDHGAASVMFALGKQVNGGRFGKRPSLQQLDANGDLAFTTDFRSAYATVIEKWVGSDPKSVLGAEFPRLGFLA